ncbi:MAG: HNH endonuclease [Blastocatellia bacterium]|nr:HNH endonuclease [Blastocatellia bacterium]
MASKDPEKAKEYRHKYYVENREKAHENTRKWRTANPEKAKEIDRKWNAANPKKSVEKTIKWQKANPEKKREYDRKWRAAHPEQARASVRICGRKWKDANPDRVREGGVKRRALKLGAVVGEVELAFIWQRDKGICYLCGNTIEPKDCHFDHVIPLSKGGAHTADNLRATHSWCNLTKQDKLIDVAQVVAWIQKKLF